MKIEFIYSPIYDNLLTDMSKKEFNEAQLKEMEFYKEELEAIWKKEESKIIKEIEKISNLKFKINRQCFIVNSMRYTAISNPLTIKKEHIERAKTILIHELIHILFEDNKVKLKELIEKTYPEEAVEFKIHVPVLLITRKVIENLYGQKEFKIVLEKEMHIDLLNSVWPEVNTIYPKFKNDIIKFLKNNHLK
ncbi:hypothetical protein J4216_03305 [Candidatus Woesearchaeota archaeon]|nr:hypothetical protein [Candidatus Woesearchaeota archaeon]